MPKSEFYDDLEPGHVDSEDCPLCDPYMAEFTMGFHRKENGELPSRDYIYINMMKVFKAFLDEIMVELEVDEIMRKNG